MYSGEEPTLLPKHAVTHFLLAPVSMQNQGNDCGCLIFIMYFYLFIYLLWVQTEYHQAVAYACSGGLSFGRRFSLEERKPPCAQ